MYIYFFGAKAMFL